MYIDYSAWETFEYKVSSLQLDVNNPRIRYNQESMNQTQIINLLVEKENIYDLAKKISEEGYYPCEEPIICIENNKKIVLEGNRRIASLKLLQNPKKYLTAIKANILTQNILKNKISIENYKIRCYIAPNRLLANPIIYDRHKGEAVKRWETGNQYSFVEEMYSEDGLSVDDICDVLNEKRSNILKIIKIYNLFMEGKEILSKEGKYINTDNFNISNLQRLFNTEGTLKFLGIDYDSEDGRLIIKLPEDEYEKRISILFDKLLNADNFSRKYNTSEELKSLIEELKKSSKVNMSVPLCKNEIKHSSTNKQNLDAAKNEITRRRKSRKTSYDNCIIAKDKELIFNDEKLDTLFAELKGLPIDKKYAFSLLLRTYLEQTLYFYLLKNNFLDDLSEKVNNNVKKNGNTKVKSLIKFLKSQYNISDVIDENKIMDILRFNNVKKDFSSISLKPMLDYVLNHKLIDSLDPQTYKVVKAQVELIKNQLDLSVHNIIYFADIETTKKAWHDLEPLLNYLCSNTNVGK